jgi:hypothetical protein
MPGASRGESGDLGAASERWSCSDWLEDCALDKEAPGMRFFCSLLGLRASASAEGDCLRMSRNLRPGVIEDVFENDRSLDFSPLPP